MRHIEECLAKGPNYEDKYYEDTIREDDTELTTKKTDMKFLSIGVSLIKNMQMKLDLKVLTTCQSLINTSQCYVGVWLLDVC